MENDTETQCQTLRERNNYIGGGHQINSLKINGIQLYESEGRNDLRGQGWRTRKEKIPLINKSLLM